MATPAGLTRAPARVHSRRTADAACSAAARHAGAAGGRARSSAQLVTTAQLVTAAGIGAAGAACARVFTGGRVGTTAVGRAARVWCGRADVVEISVRIVLTGAGEQSRAERKPSTKDPVK